MQLDHFSEDPIDAFCKHKGLSLGILDIQRNSMFSLSDQRTNQTFAMTFNPFTIITYYYTWASCLKGVLSSPLLMRTWAPLSRPPKPERLLPRLSPLPPSFSAAWTAVFSAAPSTTFCFTVPWLWWPVMERPTGMLTPSAEDEKHGRILFNSFRKLSLSQA